jgi:hypothetical protein
MQLLQWSKTDHKKNKNCDVFSIKVASMSNIDVPSIFFLLCFEVVFCLLAALFFDEFFSTSIEVTLVEVTAFVLAIMAGNLVGVGLQLFPTLFFVFST